MLPPEVFTQVFQELRGPRPSGPYNDITSKEKPDPRVSQHQDRSLSALSQLCLTSKAFRDLATPILYQSLDFTLCEGWERRGDPIYWKVDKRRVPLLVNTLERSPELGRHVLKVRLVVTLRHDHTSFIERFFVIFNNLEQLVLFGPPTVRYKAGREVVIARHQAIDDAWQNGLDVLQIDFEQLRSLCLVNAPSPLLLPTIPSLQELRQEFDAAYHSPAVPISSIPPNLITLYHSDWEPSIAEEPTGVLQSISHIQHLFLGCSIPPFIPPQFVANILFHGHRLRTFRVDMVVEEGLEFDLPPREEQTTSSQSLDKITIDLWLGGKRPPSLERLEEMRRLLFDYRHTKLIEVELSLPDVSWESDVEREVCRDHLKSTWVANGTSVVFDYYEGPR